MSSSIAEFFTLRGVAAEIAQEPAARRAERTAVVTRARQKREAAEALWSVSQPVEALRLLIEALRLFGVAALDGVSSAAATTVAAPAAVPESARKDADAETKDADAETKDADADADGNADADNDGNADADADAAATAASAAAPAVAAVAGASPLERRLLALGVSARQARATAETIDKLDSVRVPELNRDARGPETDSFRALAEAAAIIDAAVDPRVLTGREVMVRRISRGGWALVALAALCVGAWFALRGGPEVTATATGVYGDDPMFGPDRAVDDDTATEWLLPDNQPGALELRVKRPRRIERVRLVNGHNREFNDRATNAYEVEVYAGERLLKKVAGSFPQLLPAPLPVNIAIGVDGADRVRFVVKSHHRFGAALAEISLE